MYYSHEHENHEKEQHGHTHEFKENNNGFLGYVKDNLLLIIGAIVYIIALAYKSNENLLSFILFGISYLIIGGEVILSAIKNIIRGEVFDENFLMSIATIGAFFIGEYPEAVAVMLFYQIGEVFQGYAVNRSRKSISSLMDIRADYANVLRNGKEIRVSPEEVYRWIIIVKPRRVPLDGTILEGTSFIVLLHWLGNQYHVKLQLEMKNYQFNK